MVRDSLLDAVLKPDVDIALVKLLLDQGENVNALDHLSRTPLHLVAMTPHEDIANLLLVHGASVNSIDVKRRTPLHYAVLESHVDIVKLLVGCRAKVNVADKLGYTPLHHVALKPHIKIAKLLVKHGANVNAVDNLRQTPLHIVASKRHVNIAEPLGANVNDFNDHRLKPLHPVKLELYAEIVNLLFEHGADVNALDYAKQTPLHCAVKMGNLNTVRLLLDQGADVNIRDNSEYTPLHRFLYLVKVWKDRSDVFARTICSLDTSYGMVKLLLENGTVPDFENKRNILVHIAPQLKCFAELLIQYIVLRISMSHKMSKVLHQFKSVLSVHIDKESENYKYFLNIAHSCINEMKNMRRDVIFDQTLFQFVSNNCLRKTTSDCRVSSYDIDRLIILMRSGKYVVCRDLIFATIKCSGSVLVERFCELKICYQTDNSDTITLNYDCIDNLTKYISKDDVISLSILFFS